MTRESAVYIVPLWPVRVTYIVPLWNARVPYIVPLWPVRVPYIVPIWPVRVPYIVPLWPLWVPYIVPLWPVRLPYIVPLWPVWVPYIATRSRPLVKRPHKARHRSLLKLLCRFWNLDHFQERGRKSSIIALHWQTGDMLTYEGSACDISWLFLQRTTMKFELYLVHFTVLS